MEGSIKYILIVMALLLDGLSFSFARSGLRALLQSVAGRNYGSKLWKTIKSDDPVFLRGLKSYIGENDTFFRRFRACYMVFLCQLVPKWLALCLLPWCGSVAFMGLRCFLLILSFAFFLLFRFSQYPQGPVILRRRFLKKRKR